MRLVRYEEVEGVIVNTSGLKIGGTKEAVGIGETDNPVLRHPLTSLPYLPGSSLKGKLRSLLEQKYSDRSQRTGKPCDCGLRDCFICSIFGCGDPSKTEHEPTRIIMRDAVLTEESVNELAESLPGSFVEVKTETAMNRNTGSVRKGSLRPIERIPAGMKFCLAFSLRVFAEDLIPPSPRLRTYFEKLAEAFQMMEKDYLGGCGTRGYGQVKVVYDEETSMQKYLWQRAQEPLR